MLLKLPEAQYQDCVRLKRVFFSFCKSLSDEVEAVFCENFFYKVCFVGRLLESAFQSLFDHSRQSLLELLNISNVFVCFHLNIQLELV